MRTATECLQLTCIQMNGTLSIIRRPEGIGVCGTMTPSPFSSVTWPLNKEFCLAEHPHEFFFNRDPKHWRQLVIVPLNLSAK